MSAGDADRHPGRGPHPARTAPGAVHRRLQRRRGRRRDHRRCAGRPGVRDRVRHRLRHRVRSRRSWSACGWPRGCGTVTRTRPRRSGSCAWSRSRSSCSPATSRSRACAACSAGEAPDSSPVSLLLLTASLVVMPLLAAAKRRVGLALHDDLDPGRRRRDPDLRPAQRLHPARGGPVRADRRRAGWTPSPGSSSPPSPSTRAGKPGRASSPRTRTTMTTDRAADVAPVLFAVDVSVPRVGRSSTTARDTVR